MSNPFFSAMGGGNSMMQMLQQIKSNPFQFLAQRRMNLPPGMAADPQAIIQHLMSTGQISQEQLNRAYQMARNFRQ